MDLFKLFQTHFHPIVQEILGYSNNEFELLKFYCEASPLFQEVTFIISHQKKNGFFQQSHSLQEFKYDFGNNCGVLSRLTSDEKSQRHLVRTFGDERILSEKKWI